MGPLTLLGWRDLGDSPRKARRTRRELTAARARVMRLGWLRKIGRSSDRQGCRSHTRQGAASSRIGIQREVVAGTEAEGVQTPRQRGSAFSARQWRGRGGGGTCAASWRIGIQREAVAGTEAEGVQGVMLPRTSTPSRQRAGAKSRMRTTAGRSPALVRAKPVVPAGCRFP